MAIRQHCKAYFPQDISAQITLAKTSTNKNECNMMYYAEHNFLELRAIYMQKYS